MPKEHYQHWHEQWTQLAPFPAQHHWTATPEQAQQLPNAVRTQMHLLIGGGNAQCSAFSNLINQWIYPALSLWLVEDPKQWIAALRNNFSLCLEPPFEHESFATLKKLLFDRFPSLRPERLELKGQDEAIHWFPWKEIVQLHCQTEEVLIHLPQGEKQLYPTPCEQILPQLKQQIQFFPITPTHFINLNHVKEILKIDQDQYHCHLYSEEIITLNNKIFLSLRGFLKQNI